jgi:hypothetical protein
MQGRFGFAGAEVHALPEESRTAEELHRPRSARASTRSSAPANACLSRGP